MKRAVLVLLLACVALSSAAAFGETYANAEFKFAVEIPPGAPTCKSRPADQHQEIALLLDSGPPSCDSLESQRYVAIYGDHNAAKDASPEAALRDACRYLGAIQRAAPEDLTIAGLHSASCRADYPAFVVVYVTAQSCDRGDQAQVNYHARLRTTAEHFEADVARFRAFLGHVDMLSDCAPNPPP